MYRRIERGLLHLHEKTRSVWRRLEVDRIGSLEKHTRCAEGAVRLNGHGHHPTVRSEKEELFAVAPPARLGSAIRRDAHRLLRGFERTDVNLRRAGNVRL